MAHEEKVNILIVDDLPEKILGLRLVLQDPGRNIVEANSGREALRRLLEQDFAVILLDVNMPDMDGFETAQLIRQRQRSEHTPIIFITAFSDELHASRGYSLGAVDYILSPVIPEVLRTKVGVFVDLYRKTEQVKRQAEQRVALASAQAARAAAEEATRRSLFLAEASTALARSLDFEVTVRDLLRLVVPYLADLAAVTLAGTEGEPWRSELAWTLPPSCVLQTRSVTAADGPTDEVRLSLERVLAGGRTEVLEGLDVVYPFGAEAGPDDRLRTAVHLPLLARGRILGALSLAQGGSGRGLGPTDLALAEDLAGRAAIALDNARLYQDIRERDQHKNEFLAMLAHELRNPLAPISNAVGVLQMNGVPAAAQARSIQIIERQVRQMARIVDDLLDVSRITRGRIELQTRRVDLHSVVGAAVETSKPLLDTRRHDLDVDLPAEPFFVHGDPARLSQILSNLLNNAAKYTEQGGQVRLSVRREADQVVLLVRDNGLGIHPSMLSKIFDLFTQTDQSLARSEGGLGIGLTLVRRLTELHGGTVEARSEGLGQGSEFVVRLPLAAPESEPDQPPTNGYHRTSAGLPRLRTLVVDDNTDAAEMLAQYLRLSGQEVRVAHDGPAALELVEEFRPEVVLLDIGLPGMDGYEVARRLRARSNLGELLVVALSGYGQPDDRSRSRAAGFDHHLVKPVDPDALEELMALQRQRSAAVSV
jgi:signal transduction histidine kinase/DNA-binding response OmpR family regulator